MSRARIRRATGRPGGGAVRGLLAVLALVAPSSAVAARNSPEVGHADVPGIQHLHFEYGPVKIAPGQNTIEAKVNKLKPTVPGYITRFKPDLVYAKDHTVPRVDVIHLHHGVWLSNLYPTFAAGEEKTIFQLPPGFGYRYEPSDAWIMNYMIHNLTPTKTSVYITYDIDFVPATEPAAAGLTPVKPLWMDVAGISAYPIFDVKKGTGGDGRYTFPDEARGAERAKIGGAQSFTAPGEITLVSTAGHLHPGGLWTDLAVERGGVKKELFRSEAEYWEPAGAVSWDVGMTGTDADWRPTVQAGDRITVSATYDSHRASWYESMGIMVVFYAEGRLPDAKDPFAEPIDTRGLVTHGHLAENDNHGGKEAILPDARTLFGAPLAASAATIPIKGFLYGKGDLVRGDRSIPVVRKGRSLTFTNKDDKNTIWHTITACRSPCNKETGVAYPLADGPVAFDSGELGTDPTRRFATAASGKVSWSTPKSLKPGVYTYFCRVHPFMRGAFRVTAQKLKG